MSKPKQSRPGCGGCAPSGGTSLGGATMADLSGFGYWHRVTVRFRPWPGFDHAECPVPTQWIDWPRVPRRYGCAKRGRVGRGSLRIPCKVLTALDGALTTIGNTDAGERMRGRARWGLRRQRPLSGTQEHPDPGQRRAPTTMKIPLSLLQGTLSVFVLEGPGEGHWLLPSPAAINGASSLVFGDPYADGRSAHNESYRTACAGNSGGAAGSAPTEVWGP
jgi:hypothetical protein